MEPTKLGTGRIELPCPQRSCPEESAIQKERLVSGNALGCTPPKELTYEKLKQPCASACENGDKEGDVRDSNGTKTEQKNTHEEMIWVADAASSGTKEAVEKSASLMAIVPDVPQKNTKNFAGQFPEERQRTVSQETTMAEDSSGDCRDECGASQKSEPVNDTAVLPQAVASVCPAARSAADLAEATTTQPAAQKATKIDIGVDGSPGTKQLAQNNESKEIPISQQAAPSVQTETMGTANDAKEPLGEESQSRAGQLNEYHNVEIKFNLSGQKTKSSSQDAGQNAKRKKRSARPDKAESAALMDTKNVLTEHEKEASGEDMVIDSQNEADNGRSKVSPTSRRHQKKKKPSKAKGKRRHGKTGRR